MTLSNFTDTQIQLSNNMSQSALDNGVAAATLGGAPNWATCLACASLQRSFERSGTTRPDVCTQCLNLYCWNGDVGNTKQNNTNYAPNIGTPGWVTQNAATITRMDTNGAAGLVPSSQVASLLAAVVVLAASI